MQTEFNTINLKGTWREMGREYGEWLKGKHLTIPETPICSFPLKFKEIMLGISETSDISYDDIARLNSLHSPKCCGSVIAAWSSYSKTSLVLGRNYDTPTVPDSQFVCVCWHPTDGSPAVASIGLAGNILCCDMMNEYGLFMAVNDGSASGGTITYTNRMLARAMLFDFMLGASTLDEIEAYFNTVRSNTALIAGVADAQTARCFEWPAFGIKKRLSRSRPGLTVFTNHFTEDSWGLPRPKDEDFYETRSRRRNLLNLAKHLKGAIDEHVMMNILDTRFEELGATSDRTRFQMSVVPEKFALWHRLPQEGEWILTDMKELFNDK